MLYRRFCQFIKRENLLLAGENLIIGISGGPDSVALGHLFKRWQKEHGGTIVAGHVNHLLRAAAIQEAQLTARLCAEWDWPCHIAEIDVKTLCEQSGSSLQAIAREERLVFFQTLSAQYRITKLALGHQADDQTETILFWLLRGCGIGALPPRSAAHRLCSRLGRIRSGP